MEEKRRDAIIDDIMTLRPKGDEGENPVFENESYFCYEAYKDKIRVLCSHPHWGYAPETLFSMNIHDEGSARRYVLLRWYEGKTAHELRAGQKAGVTRKVNRLWGRLSPAITKIRKEGRPGVYNIGQGYYGELLGTVYAQDHDDAKKLGTLFYGYLSSEEGDLRTTFVQLGGLDIIQATNEKAIRRIESDITDARKKVKKTQNAISRYEMQIEAIRMLQMHTLGQMSDENA